MLYFSDQNVCAADKILTCFCFFDDRENIGLIVKFIFDVNVIANCYVNFGSALQLFALTMNKC
jgi:hypothetical protein